MPTAWQNISDTNSKIITTDLNVPNINVPPGIPKIAICIPFNGYWIPEWVERLYLPLVCTPIDWAQKISFLSKVPSLPVARDMLVKQAIKYDCDYLFFMDADHVLEQPTNPNIAIHQLYQAINKDKNSKNGKIVSGLYRAKQRTGFNYAAWLDAPNDVKGFIAIQEWIGNWIQVDVVGLGFCLIDIQIFKEVPSPWFVWNEQDDMSEDFYFCKLAKKYGYTTWVFTDIRLSHLGNLKVLSDGRVTVQEI